MASRSKACWECGFESRQRYGCQSVVSVVRVCVGVLSCRGLCVGPITLPEEPYRMWRV